MSVPLAFQDNLDVLVVVHVTLLKDIGGMC